MAAVMAHQNERSIVRGGKKYETAGRTMISTRGRPQGFM